MFGTISITSAGVIECGTFIIGTVVIFLAGYNCVKQTEKTLCCSGSPMPCWSLLSTCFACCGFPFGNF